MRKMKLGKRPPSGRAWKSSPSRRSRRPSSQRIPERRPRCRSGSSPSQRRRGIGSARSRTRPWSWKQNPSLPTAAVSAQRASRSPATSSGEHPNCLYLAKIQQCGLFSDGLCASINERKCFLILMIGLWVLLPFRFRLIPNTDGSNEKSNRFSTV